MTKSIEFYFDYGSPAQYLAWTQLEKLRAHEGTEIVYRPMLLGGVFKATGNQTPMAIKAKGEWMQHDLARFAKRYDVPFVMNPYFMINTLPLMRGAIWAQRDGEFDKYNRTMQRAMWVDGVDMNSPEEIGKVLAGAGFDPSVIVKAIGDPAIKAGLIEATDAAVERGVFGAPTMFVNGEMHFGQDRIDWVAKATKK